MDNIGEIVREGCVAFSEMRKNAKYLDSDEYVLAVSDNLYRTMHSQIHGYLAQLRDNEGEDEIRKHIEYVCKFVLPTLRDKLKKMAVLADKLKKEKFTEENRARLLKLQENYTEYGKLYENFYALSAFRNIEHFALYMEWGMPENDKVWKYNLNCFKGFWYYADKMVLDGTVKYLEKQCPVGYGKCLKADTPILTTQGYKPIKNVNIGDFVYSMKENKPVVRRITNKWNTEKKQIKIRLNNGKEIICSPEHRLYTDKGYKMCKDITISDYLFEICSPLNYGYEIDEDELFFVTCMIFDGHCKQARFRFIKEKNEILDRFISVLDKWGVTYSVSHPSKAYEVRIHSANGKVADVLTRYGVINHLSYTKRLPKQFFEMSLKQRYKFIGIMFATDGWINKGESPCGISLANEGLIQDIQRLLGTCGIYSYYCHRKSKCEGKTFDCYNLTIPDEFINKLYKNCYCYHKQENLKNRVEWLFSKSMPPYSNNVNYPKSVVCHCKELKKIKNKSWAKTLSFKKQWIDEFSEKTGLLKDVVSNDFVWQKIKSIEFDEDLTDMVDIEVEETHNFIANGIVSHNSYADTVLISYIFGIDINADVLKIVGNPSLITDMSAKLVKYMCKPNYAKVFPYYAQFEGDKDKIFDVRREGGNNQVARLLIHGSIKGTSFLLANKDTPVDGGRYKYRFYDDITRSKDKGNINMHEKDIERYQDQWKKRRYDDNNSFEVFSGTTYHIYDFLSTIKRKYGGDTAKQSKINKYTKFNAWYKAVFVSVPKLDWDTDESTYPHKYTTEEARSERLADYNTFMAMDMQEPMPIEGCAFSYDNLLTYKAIPHIEEEKDEESCWAMLDPARTGANYIAMAICLPIGDKHYLKDCIFEMKPMEKIYPTIIRKIEQHHITRLHIERNTDTSLATLLRGMLYERGIDYCNITEVYSYKHKEDKIYDNEAVIKSSIVFPEFGMYAQGSEFGKFMKYLTSFSYTAHNAYDDSIDVIAMYAQKYLSFKKRQNSITILNRRRAN